MSTTVPHQNLVSHNKHTQNDHHNQHHSEHKSTLEKFATKVHDTTKVKWTKGNIIAIVVIYVVFGLPAAYLSYRWNIHSHPLWKWTCVFFAFAFNLYYLIVFALLAHEATIENPRWANRQTTAPGGLLGGGFKKYRK